MAVLEKQLVLPEETSPSSGPRLNTTSKRNSERVRRVLHGAPPTRPYQNAFCWSAAPTDMPRRRSDLQLGAAHLYPPKKLRRYLASHQTGDPSSNFSNYCCATFQCRCSSRIAACLCLALLWRAMMDWKMAGPACWSRPTCIGPHHPGPIPQITLVRCQHASVIFPSRNMILHGIQGLCFGPHLGSAAEGPSDSVLAYSVCV